MSWMLRLVPPRRHQHIDGPGPTAEEAAALVRDVFGADVVEVSATEEAREVLRATGGLRRSA